MELCVSVIYTICVCETAIYTVSVCLSVSMVYKINVNEIVSVI